MKPNIELLKRLRTRFLRMRHPEHFQMDVIAIKTDCGSVMCVAGHALDLAGYRRRLLPPAQRSAVIDYSYLSPTGAKVRNVLSAAAKELGIGKYDTVLDNTAYQLFHDWSLTTPNDAAARISKLIEEYEQA